MLACLDRFAAPLLGASHSSSRLPVGAKIGCDTFRALAGMDLVSPTTSAFEDMAMDSNNCILS
jgi:hypothetical protein